MLLMLDKHHQNLETSETPRQAALNLSITVIYYPLTPGSVQCYPGNLRLSRTRIPEIMPLTDTQIRNTTPGNKLIKLTDGGRLYLQVRPSGAKLWRYRYRIADKENVFAAGEYVQAQTRREWCKRYRHAVGRDMGCLTSLFRHQVAEINP